MVKDRSKMTDEERKYERIDGFGYSLAAGINAQIIYFYPPKEKNNVLKAAPLEKKIKVTTTCIAAALFIQRQKNRRQYISAAT